LKNQIEMKFEQKIDQIFHTETLESLHKKLYLLKIYQLMDTSMKIFINAVKYI